MDRITLLVFFTILIIGIIYFYKYKASISVWVDKLKNLVKKSTLENFENSMGLKNKDQFSFSKIIEKLNKKNSDKDYTFKDYKIGIGWKNDVSKGKDECYGKMENIDHARYSPIDVFNSILWGDFINVIDNMYSPDTPCFCPGKNMRVMDLYDLNTAENNAHILLTFKRNPFFPTLNVCNVKMKIMPKSMYIGLKKYGKTEFVIMMKYILIKMLGLSKTVSLGKIRLTMAETCCDCEDKSEDEKQAYIDEIINDVITENKNIVVKMDDDGKIGLYLENKSNAVTTIYRDKDAISAFAEHHCAIMDNIDEIKVGGRVKYENDELIIKGDKNNENYTMHVFSL